MEVARPRKEFYSTSEAAAIAHLHKNTVINALNRGLLRSFKTPGGHHRIRRDSLVSFLENQGIPYEPEELETGKVRRGARVARRTKKILIVEDDRNLTSKMARTLTKANYLVKWAERGYDAGFITAEFRPHLILLDIMLPDISGEQVLERLRSNGKTANTKVVVISGVLDESRVKRLANLGVGAFIEKPFSLRKMVDLVTTVLGQK